MTLTVADIERWDAGDVREVFHAATSRAQAAHDAADGLAELPAFATWGGEAAEAAKEAIGKTRADLNAHGQEALAVANAARSAADEIERIKSDLATLKADAAALGMEIDPLSGQVIAGPGASGNPMEVLLKQQQLQPRVDKLIAEANLVDMALANAIDMAGGQTPIPDSPHANDPDVQAALSKPLPEDPRAFNELWDKLSNEQKDWLYEQNPNIGNHPGMPVGDTAVYGKDHYNRRNLADQLPPARAAAAEAEALRAAHPDWAHGENIPEPNKPGAIFFDRTAYEAWQRKYDDALSRSRHLPDLQAVQQSLGDDPNRKLMLLDTVTGDHAKAAIAIGNPDTADHVSVTAPGLNTTVSGSISGMTEEATNLQREALRQLGGIPGREMESVATIAWIGYNPPQVPGGDDLLGSLQGGWDVSHTDVAAAGAVDLSRFYEGIQAAHAEGGTHLTAVGHSYGSLTTGLALQEPGTHGVTDAIFYGSPGIEATTPQELGLQPGHAYAMMIPDDPIRYVYDAPGLVNQLPYIGPILGAGAELSGTGDFGPNPATNPNFTRLATGPATITDGGASFSLDGASGHSDYPRQGGNGMPRTTGFNIAAVIAGLEQNAVRGE